MRDLQYDSELKKENNTNVWPSEWADNHSHVR